MFFAIITLLTALSIAGIAAWFSIVGLMSIFSAQALSTAIMAGALEVGKLVSASWLYRNWRIAGWFIKSYLIVAVLVLMLITSMGIFGFLSKAHLENTAVSSEVALSIERIDAKIAREEQKVRDAQLVIGQLDETVQVLMKNERIRGPDGALAVRKSQTEERAALNAEIEQASATLGTLQDQRLELSQRNLAVEKELGPLKYVAELVYTDQSSENLDRAVRMFILLLVSVFDPLAVILLIAANKSLMSHGIVLEPPASAVIDKVSEPVNIVEPVSVVEPEIAKVNEKTQPESVEQVNIPEVAVVDVVENPVEPEVRDTVEDQVEPEVREMVEDLIENETTDIKQLQAVAKHLANSKANKSNMTEDEIVEVLASSTKESEARKKLGFWAVRLPDKD